MAADPSGGFLVVPRGPGLLAYAAVLLAAWWAFWVIAGFPLITYHVLMSAVLIPLVAWRQPTVSATLSRIPLPVPLRFIALAYAAVIAEETLVGTLASLLAEGDPAAWADRVRQFITLNLFVFTGPILALALHARLCAPHRWELVVMAGGWGLFAEAILQRMLSYPLLAGLLVWPTMVIYALIFLPATLSIAPSRGTRRPPFSAARRPHLGAGLRPLDPGDPDGRTPARHHAGPLSALRIYRLRRPRARAHRRLTATCDGILSGCRVTVEVAALSFPHVPPNASPHGPDARLRPDGGPRRPLAARALRRGAGDQQRPRHPPRLDAPHPPL